MEPEQVFYVLSVFVDDENWNRDEAGDLVRDLKGQVFVDAVAAVNHEDAEDKLLEARPYALVDEVMNRDSLRKWFNDLLSMQPEHARAILAEVAASG